MSSRPLLRRILAVLLIVALPLFLTSCVEDYQSSELQVYFIDVGPQGDAELVIAPTGETLLVDSGNEATTVQGFLDELGVDRIDIMVNSHPHADHIGGALQVLQHVQVDEVWDVGVAYSSGLYEKVLEEIASQVEDGRLTFAMARTGMTAQLGPEVELEVLHPTDPELWENINNTSITFRLTYGDFSILFTGDIEAEAEEAILQRGTDVSATLLKVAHHGSYSSTTTEFLEAVSPEYAIILAGQNNPYGHPHQSTLDKLAERDIEFAYTAVSGTIKVTSNGTTYKVLSEEEWRGE